MAPEDNQAYESQLQECIDEIHSLQEKNARLLDENRQLHEAMQRDEALAIMANARETVFKLNDYCSALKDSTNLLRSLSDPSKTVNVPDQIAANEQLLGGTHDTD